jgi:proline dehydrogenase
MAAQANHAEQSHTTTTTMNNATQSSQDLTSASTGALFRGLVVYSALSFPSFVDASPTILKVATSIPIVKQVALTVVRHTFFKQFVGGETFQDTIPLVQALRARNVASMIDYSVEVDEDAAKQNSKKSKKALTPYEQNIQEIKKSISEAAALENSRENGNAFTRKTFVAIKLVSLYYRIMESVTKIYLVCSITVCR